MKSTTITNTKSPTKFLTTAQFDSGIKQLMKDISQLFYSKFEENDTKWETNENRWDEADKKFDKLAVGQDRILKELVDMRDENSASTLRFERNEESLDNHETRLKSLENAKN